MKPRKVGGEIMEFEIVQRKEGDVVFFVAEQSIKTKESTYQLTKSPVFYNPKQELNRDLSVVAFQAFFSSVENLSFCDAFTGCGIRALRYAKEVPHVGEVVACDMNQQAVLLTEFNVKKSKLGRKIKVSHNNANSLFYERFSKSIELPRFNLVDIDPFGTPVPYMQAALSAVKRKGSLIALTATDMPALCGVYPKVSYRKYGGWSIRAPFSHEIAIRLLLGSMARAAFIFDKGIRVRFAYYADHYIRAIVEPRPSASAAMKTLSEMGYIFYCGKCHAQGIFLLKPNEYPDRHCDDCGEERHIAGPLFLGSLFDTPLLKKMLKLSEEKPLGTKEKVNRILNLQISESKGPPLFFNIHKLCKGFSFSIPRIETILDDLVAKGFFASKTHFSPISIRTNATHHDLLETIRNVGK
jgi:tRNA (guanine26-N2/guanine27-N2)-dimethyltransferase